MVGAVRSLARRDAAGEPLLFYRGAYSRILSDGMSLPPEPAELLVLLGSTTRPGRLRRALEESLTRFAEDGRRAELLDLAELRIAFADGPRPRPWRTTPRASSPR